MPRKFNPYMAVLSRDGLIPIEDYKDLGNPRALIVVACPMEKGRFKEWAKWRYYKPGKGLGGESMWEDAMQSYTSGEVTFLRKPDSKVILIVGCFQENQEYMYLLGQLEPDHQFTGIINRVMDRFLKSYWSKVV